MWSSVSIFIPRKVPKLNRLQRLEDGKIPSVGRDGARDAENGGKRVLLLAARQPELLGLLEEAGFSVDAQRHPNGEDVEADVAVVFRGRLIGRNQAASLADRGIPVIEVLTSEPTSPSTGAWLRLSNRMQKSDLVQVVRAVADWAGRSRPSRRA
jgi:hypothetical protein